MPRPLVTGLRVHSAATKDRRSRRSLLFEVPLRQQPRAEAGCSGLVSVRDLPASNSRLLAEQRSILGALARGLPPAALSLADRQSALDGVLC